MPLPRLPGLGIEKILLLLEQFFSEAVPNFFGFSMKGGNKGLCFLGCAHRSIGLNGEHARKRVHE